MREPPLDRQTERACTLLRQVRAQRHDAARFGREHDAVVDRKRVGVEAHFDGARVVRDLERERAPLARLERDRVGLQYRPVVLERQHAGDVHFAPRAREARERDADMVVRAILRRSARRVHDRDVVERLPDRDDLHFGRIQGRLEPVGDEHDRTSAGELQPECDRSEQIVADRGWNERRQAVARLARKRSRARTPPLDVPR